MSISSTTSPIHEHESSNLRGIEGEPKIQLFSLLDSIENRFPNTPKIQELLLSIRSRLEKSPDSVQGGISKHIGQFLQVPYPTGLEAATQALIGAK